MTTDATRADARLSMSRRAALTATGAGIVAALSGSAQAESADPSLAALNALIARHASEYERDIANWTAASEIEDAHHKTWPKIRVQVGRVLRDRDANGNEVFDPRYAYSPQHVRGHYEQLREAGWPWSAPNRDMRIRERMQSKLDEMATITAVRRRAEDECGYSAAMDKAVASSEVVKAIEADILGFVPGSLPAAARLCEWITDRMSDDRAYFCGDEEAPFAALRSIGKAVQS